MSDEEIQAIEKRARETQPGAHGPHSLLLAKDVEDLIAEVKRLREAAKALEQVHGLTHRAWYDAAKLQTEIVTITRPALDAIRAREQKSNE